MIMKRNREKNEATGGQRDKLKERLKRLERHDKRHREKRKET